MSPYYGQGEGVSRVHKVHIGHLLNLLFICMCNAGMCAYVGVCHAMSPLVGYVCIWGVCMGMCACVGVCHAMRSEEHTSELQSLMRISYAVFCLKKKNNH